MKESFEIEEYCLIKSPKIYDRRSTRQQDSRVAKKPKIDFIDQEGSNEYQAELDDCDQLLYEELATGNENSEEEVREENENLEIMFLRESEDVDSEKVSKISVTQNPLSLPVMSREEKFIQAVYPQFKGKTKLQLIEDILDLKRRNDLLQSKAKTYENTINRLLN